MRISDWSSDVCSSDLNCRDQGPDNTLALLAGSGRKSRFAAEIGESAAREDIAPCKDRFKIYLRAIEIRMKEFDMRSEEHTSELQSLMRISYAVFCLKKKRKIHKTRNTHHNKSQTHKPTK